MHVPAANRTFFFASPPGCQGRVGTRGYFQKPRSGCSLPSGSPAEPWLTSSGTSSLTAAAACSVLGTPRGATAGDTGMGGTGRAKRAQWGRGSGGVLRGCRMEGDTVGSWGHRVTVGQKMGRRLWEWGTVEPRGLWKEPEHGCEARQRQGVAVGWRQLGGRGMGGMRRQRERDVRRLWDGGIGWL